jgi:hypothetical protein
VKTILRQFEFAYRKYTVMENTGKISLLEQFDLFDALTDQEKIRLSEVMEFRKKPPVFHHLPAR